jgi:hypothetical protein
MFCPRCGSTQDEHLKFCTACGSNLYAVKQALDTRDPSLQRDSNTPWFAEIARSDAESKRRKEELDHRRGITPEVRRYNEIKAGVITGSAGLGLSIVLLVLMNGIILSGNVSPAAAEILSRLWIAGLIPIFVGLALIVNGVFVSKKLAEVVRRAAQPALPTEPALQPDTNPLEPRPPDTTRITPSSYSVTENTTKHLEIDGQNR